MPTTEIPRSSAEPGMNRRQLLGLGSAVLLAGCIGHIEEEIREITPIETDEQQRAVGALDFQGFTHFPIDFAAAFAEPETVEWREEEYEGIQMWRVPVSMFFNPPHKIVSARKWYFWNPHEITEEEEDQVHDTALWDIYLVADGVLAADNIIVEFDRDFNYLEGARLNEVNRDELLQDEVDGETVYRDLTAGFLVNEHVRVDYGSSLRKEIVDEVVDGGGVAVIPAGTHLGYAYGGHSMGVGDERIEPEYGSPGVNPFDYFTEEKQQELLEIYQPVYEMLKDEGIHPFTDLTMSLLEWDVPGSIEGVWVRPDLGGEAFHGGGSWWGIINLVNKEHTNEETYWRVLEHPWNVANNLVGLFIEDTGGDQPDQPLYDVTDVMEPFGKSRFYLVDGDLSDGIAMIIKVRGGEFATHVWLPLEPDTEENHPSIGARRYLRFQVMRADNSRDETLKIEGFLTEADARNGFTEEAQLYLRDPGYLY